MVEPPAIHTQPGLAQGGGDRAQEKIDLILERLHRLHPVLIDLSLDRLQRLLGTLGNPERQLPPIIHVAGTNGKGSTCAFLRAIGEAAGMRVHVYTSPHLVRFNERIRLAGELVSDEALAEALSKIEQINGDAPITVFEVITAVAFHLFAAVPAELCVLEVGLGGRGDATNVIPRPAACAITSISLDHREMLGQTLSAIAREKAGILKPGSPVAVGSQSPAALDVIKHHAAKVGAPLYLRDQHWTISPSPAGFSYADQRGVLHLPSPSLTGAHQLDNAGIAVAALRASSLLVPDDAIAAGLATADWPARLQRLHGSLAALLPEGSELWLDGGHNPGAAQALAEHLRGWSDRPIYLVVGMKKAKDIEEFLHPLIRRATAVWAVAEPEQHAAVPVETIIAASRGIAREGPTVIDALAQIAKEHHPARILICGSLYLAGEVLKADKCSIT
jgi:dihydrofolate synthase / folylpolyglutamate synthase